MPLYSYFCEAGHETERFLRASERSKPFNCGQCGDPASYRPTVSRYMSDDVERFVETRRIESSQEREKDKGYVWRDIKCEKCGYTDLEDIDTSGAGVAPDEVACPKCDGTAQVMPISFNIDRFSERFPYFDRGLGIWLQSKQHRRDVCRERGLTPIEGDWDVDSEFRKWDDENGKDEANYKKYCDRLDNDPAFRSFRKAQDQGKI